MSLGVDDRLFRVVIIVAALCKTDGRQNTSYYSIRSEMPWIRAEQIMQSVGSACVHAPHADSAAHDRMDVQLACFSDEQAVVTGHC
jgi:hypothetical protein